MSAPCLHDGPRYADSGLIDICGACYTSVEYDCGAASAFGLMGMAEAIRVGFATREAFLARLLLLNPGRTDISAQHLDDGLMVIHYAGKPPIMSEGER